MGIGSGKSHTTQSDILRNNFFFRDGGLPPLQALDYRPQPKVSAGDFLALSTILSFQDSQRKRERKREREERGRLVLQRLYPLQPHGWDILGDLMSDQPLAATVLKLNTEAEGYGCLQGTPRASGHKPAAHPGSRKHCFCSEKYTFTMSALATKCRPNQQLAQTAPGH